MKKHMVSRKQMSKKWFILAVVLLLVILLPIIVSVFTTKQQTETHAATAGFVYRNGKTMMLNGAPYKFVGFNAYGMTGCETGSPWSQAQIDAYFQSLPPASMTRIWAFETRSQNLDLIVERAAANNQKLVMTLGNGLKNCEDVGDTGGGRGASWFQSGYKGAYLNWVKATVAKYKNSPAVGMWEVSNEGGHPDKVDPAIMSAYYEVVGSAIKALDPDHLVSTGALAEYTYGGTPGYQTIHSSPSIDVISFHEYDGNGISSHFSAAQQVSNALNKPIMVGETGVSACDPERANLLKGKFDGYLAQGASGVLLWNRSLSSGCGFSKIGPSDQTSTMVKDYKISGVALTPPAGGTAPTLVTPTFYCEGSCPTLTSTIPAGGTQAPSNGPVTAAPTEPNTSIAPCESTTSVATEGHGKRKHKKHKGMWQWFWEFLIQLINRILERLGLPKLDLPGGSTPVPPVTPGNPGNPGQPQPTVTQPQQPGNPCPPTNSPQQPQPTATTAPVAPTTGPAPTTPPVGGGEKTPPAGGPWTLIENMSDEFDGDKVDTSKWRFTSSAEADCEGDGISLESGCRNPGNQQMEFNWGKNCTVSGGILTITAKKETHGSSQWTSCMLHSANKAKEMYMEAKIKIPATPGFWPAFWTWEGPQNEVDVFEYYTEAKQFSMTNHTGGGGGCDAQGFNPTDGYHVYAANIEGGKTTFYIDGKEQCVTNGAPQAAVSILLDMFVHDRQRQAKDSEVLLTDYIRAWKKQ